MTGSHFSCAFERWSSRPRSSFISNLAAVVDAGTSPLATKETSFMTRHSRSLLYRRLATVAIAIAAATSVLPAQAQHRDDHGGGRGGYHGGHGDDHGGYRGGGGGGGGLLVGALLGVVAGAAIVGAATQAPPPVVYSAPPPPPPPGVAYYPNSYPPGY